jgi:catechol 2,3-dioxygenase-like lactoylglutathione lyase family enzyme
MVLSSDWNPHANSMSPAESTSAPGFLRVFPILGVSDLAAALVFYRDILGFTVAWQWGNPPSRAGVTRGDVELQLLGDPRLRPAAGRVYIHMTGVAAFYREVGDRGAHIYEPLVDRDWGMRDFRILDPSGNQLGFAEQISRPPAEMRLSGPSDSSVRS